MFKLIGFTAKLAILCVALWFALTSTPLSTVLPALNQIPGVGSVLTSAGVQAPANVPGHFLRTRPSGDPVGWNPCGVINYKVSKANYIKGGVKDIKKAAEIVSKATGLRFHYAGVTSEQPTQEYVAATEGQNDAPVIIGWGHPSTNPLLTQTASAVTHPVAANVNGTEYWVGGVLVLNVEHNDLYAHGANPSRVDLLVHEMGHLVGLDHNPDGSQLMFYQMGRATALGDQDRAELQAVGGTCTTR